MGGHSSGVSESFFPSPAETATSRAPLRDSKDPYAAFEARRGARLVAVSAADGKKLSETPLECPPVFDGMIAAGGRLFASLQDGSVVSLAAK